MIRYLARFLWHGARLTGWGLVAAFFFGVDVVLAWRDRLVDVPDMRGTVMA